MPVRINRGGRSQGEYRLDLADGSPGNGCLLVALAHAGICLLRQRLGATEMLRSGHWRTPLGLFTRRHGLLNVHVDAAIKQQK
jgi:hypothetical protein